LSPLKENIVVLRGTMIRLFADRLKYLGREELPRTQQSGNSEWLFTPYQAYWSAGISLATTRNGSRNKVKYLCTLFRGGSRPSFYRIRYVCPFRRFSGLSHMRQCGDDVLRMLVTGGPLVRGGGGIPHRIIANSRPSPSSVLRMTGAGKSGNTPVIGARLPT